MAFTNIGPISAAAFAATGTVAVGTYTPAQQTLPIGYDTIIVLLDLTQCRTLTAILTVKVEYSIDNGANWISAGESGLNLPTSGYHIQGNTLLDAANVPVRITGFMNTIPHRELARPARVTFTVAGASVIVGAYVGAW